MTVHASELFGQSLRDDGEGWTLRCTDRGVLPLPVRSWTCTGRAGDAELLDLCRGRVLDVGCGPGRLTVALQGRGRPVLGVDLSPGATEIARSRGARALTRDVFGPLPGGWSTVLLADGNVGIGGDPARLLRRCRDLLAPGGRVVVEVGVPGSRTGSSLLRLEHALAESTWFPWATLAADDVTGTALACGLTPTALTPLGPGATTTGGGARWCAVLTR